MRMDWTQNCHGSPVSLLRVLHLLVLGLASGWHEPRASRVKAKAFVLVPFDTTRNLNRFSQAMQDLEGNHFAALTHAGPRSQLIKLWPSMFGLYWADQPAPIPFAARHIRRGPCLGIAGPAPWKSRRGRNSISPSPEVEQDLQEKRKIGDMRGLRRASARDGDRYRLDSMSEGNAAPLGADGTIEDALVAESGDSDVAPGGEKGQRGSNSWVKDRWEYAMTKIKNEPLQILTIPLSAAFVGWITNKLAVEMIFHPLTWRGIPLRVIEGQPFGLIGWQGIVPAKTGVMSERLVDMVTTQLVDVEEVFRRLSPRKVSRLLGPEINTIVQSVFEDLSPRPLAWLPGGFGCRLPSQAVDDLKGLRRSMLVGLTKDVHEHVHKVLDLKDMVVGEMLRDRSLMVSLFQQCGKAEFQFLVNSGFFFGFLLGVLQMFIWLVYDKPWILPAGGALVGYLTNWLAIKLIFEPVDPVKFGPFVLQGLFLKRQNEVAADFAEFFANNVLTSQKLWRTLLDGSRAGAFRELVTGRVVPFVSRASAVAGANLDPLTVKGLAVRAADKLRDHVHVLYEYTDKTLALQETMTTQMQKMSTRTFEGVLHPVFQEEEFILIVAGAILGAIAGFLQMLLSTRSVRKAAKIEAAKAAEAAAAAANKVAEVGGELVDGVVGNAPAHVVQAARKTVFGWRHRVTCSAKRCTSSALQVAKFALLSLSASSKASAVAITGGCRRCIRSCRLGSDCTSVVSEASNSDHPEPETCESALPESGDS